MPLEGIHVEAYKGTRRKHNMKFRQIGHTTSQYGQSFLDLPTLQFRRERADMLQVFKILNGYEDIDSSRLFTLSSTGLRGHSLFKERSRLLLCKQTFTQRVVDSWNNLPENVVNAPSINAFRSRFNTHTGGAESKFCLTWCQPSTSNDHKCAPGLTNSNTITGGSL